MLEVFAGMAVLCAVSKSFGMESSVAVDKARKRNARASIVQLDLTLKSDQCVVDQWLQSDLLLWIHLAPVCGTASRAREIRRFKGDPQPLRSSEFPEGLPSLSDRDQVRVDLANRLFDYACHLFSRACALGILVTMENPRNSYFWETVWVRVLMCTWPLFHGDFQACMLGSGRDKWTRVLGNAPFVEALHIPCNKQHSHLPWGFTLTADGKQVWATSVESEYPKKFCVALVNLVLQFAAERGLTLKPLALEEAADHPLKQAQLMQIAAGKQPRPSRVPPVVPDFSSVAVFRTKDISDIPCTLMSKLATKLSLYTATGLLEEVPCNSRFLRCSAKPAPSMGAVSGEQVDMGDYPFEVAFGLPWECEGFIQKACKVGHPNSHSAKLPWELQQCIDKQTEWSEQQLKDFRVHWCRKWLQRCKFLEQAECADRASRPAHIAEATKGKRLLLTQEILQDFNYEDTGALELLKSGATLAGDIPKCPVFEEQFKPCLTTIAQLEHTSPQRNAMVLGMTRSSGCDDLDKRVLAVTRAEVERGWAEGPFSLEELESGATISRRFPLQQGPKTRMIDDFSISGVNDSCTAHNKIDLHMIDTFAAAVRYFFQAKQKTGLDTSLEAKTYDLKSAYRQVPICCKHLKFAYFSIYNCEKQCAEVYKMKTLPVGATHSVYNFLRLARMLFAIATRALFLMTTNFYDDFVLASTPGLRESSRSSMELVFMLTGWEFDREGKKATVFSTMCQALGVNFDLSSSKDALLRVDNTEKRKQELITQLKECLCNGTISRQDTLSLRGRLGFADSFIHGRLGSVVLKQLVDHAYGNSAQISFELEQSLEIMVERLNSSGPRVVSASADRQWFVYTDAAFNSEDGTGGLGGVLVDGLACVVSWFGILLDGNQCELCGSKQKGSIIYELELLASVLALALWSKPGFGNQHVWFGDNDSVRHSLIRANGSGSVAKALLSYYLRHESLQSAAVWFARVPTEANLSDFPSRGKCHPLLRPDLDQSLVAQHTLEDILLYLQKGNTNVNGGGEIGVPLWKKASLQSAAVDEKDDAVHL